MALKSYFTSQCFFYKVEQYWRYDMIYYRNLINLQIYGKKILKQLHWFRKKKK